MRTRVVVSPDGVTVEARVFSGSTPPRHALLFMPAMGAPPKIYDGFAEALASSGIGVFLGDHRGGIASSVRPRRGVDFDYADMLERDWPALEAAAREAFPGARLHLGGHSLGGQLASIYAGTRGTRLGFGGLQARGVMLDWARESRHGRYTSRRGTLDLESRLREVSRPTLAVHVRGDRLAPEGTLDALLRRMPNARIERRDVEPPPEPRRLDPHFRWTRAPAPTATAIGSFLQT